MLGISATIAFMERKKVLIFSLAYFPKHVGGAEVSVKEITDRIPDIEFHMVTNRFDSTLPRVEKVGNVLVHRIGLTAHNPTMADLKKFPLHLNKILFQFLAVIKAQLLHRTYAYDAIWALTAHSSGVPAALFKMLNPEVNYVLNLQEGDPPEYVEKKMRPLWPLFKRAFTSADVVQPLSNFLAAWARRMGAKGSIEIIPNAVNNAQFSQPFPEERIVQKRIDIGKNMGEVYLVTTSRLVKKNAIDDVIRALPLIPLNVHFLICGVGPDEVMLKKMCANLGVESRVHFMGECPHAEMPLLLRACDIFIRPSRSEGFGASFVEAMAAGLPVIATQEGGIADFLFDEKRNPEQPITGFAVDRDSPQQIAEAVKAIMAHPEKVRAVTATAQAMVAEKYDWDHIAKMMRTRVFERLFRA